MSHVHTPSGIICLLGRISPPPPPGWFHCMRCAECGDRVPWEEWPDEVHQNSARLQAERLRTITMQAIPRSTPCAERDPV